MLLLHYYYEKESSNYKEICEKNCEKVRKEGGYKDHSEGRKEVGEASHHTIYKTSIEEKEDDY